MEEVKRLKTNTQEFIKQSHSWISLYDGLIDSLKEAGDIANWYNVLEKRARGINEKMSPQNEHAVVKTEEIAKKND